MATDQPDELRPTLTPSLAESEFLRWYWTLEELRTFARTIGVPASGAKADVTSRIAAKLGGRSAGRSKRSPTVDGITGPLSRATVIPAKQRATQELRQYFEDEIGPSFRFNGHMRAFLAQGGSTLGEAIDHWYRTVGTELPKQSESLEFNRFTKEWHKAHPNGTPAEARAAWLRFRSSARDRRPPVAEA